MIKKYILLFLIIVCNNSFYGQSYMKDEFYLQKAISFQKNKDSLLFYAKKLQQSNDHCKAIMGMYLEGKVLYMKGKYSSCEKKLNNILSLTEGTRKGKNFQYSTILIGKTYKECINIVKLNIYLRFFYIKKNQNNYSEAYKYLTYSQHIIDKLPIKNSYYYRKKITIQKEIAQLKYSIKAHKESLQILLKVNNQIKNIKTDSLNIWGNHFLLEKANINILIGLNYKELSKNNKDLIDSMEVYYNKAYLLTQKVDDTLKIHKGSHYLRKSSISFLKNEFHNAIKHANIAKNYYNNKGVPIVSKLKLQCFAKLKKADSVIKYGNEILTFINKKDGYEDYKIETYKYLSESYYELNLLNKAYQYSQKFIQKRTTNNKSKLIMDKIFKDEEISRIVNLNKSIEKKMDESQNRFLLTIFLSLACIFGITFFFIKKQKTHVKETNTKNKILETIHITGSTNKPHAIDENFENTILKKLDEIEMSDLFLDQDFNLQELAKQLNTNTTYLSKIINKYKQKTFRQYLIELRINRLIRNLEEKPIQRKYSVLALAESIGYKNASSFRRTFKNHMGVTLTQYINNKYT